MTNEQQRSHEAQMKSSELAVNLLWVVTLITGTVWVLDQMGR